MEGRVAPRACADALLRMLDRLRNKERYEACALLRVAPTIAHFADEGAEMTAQVL